MTRLFVSPRAERDIDDIAAYIARDNLRVARRFLTHVAGTLSTVQQFPGIGARWVAPRMPITDLRSCRVRGFPALHVYDTLDDSSVTVLRVLHSARDVATIMEQDIPV